MTNAEFRDVMTSEIKKSDNKEYTTIEVNGGYKDVDWVS